MKPFLVVSRGGLLVKHLPGWCWTMVVAGGLLVGTIPVVEHEKITGSCLCTSNTLIYSSRGKAILVTFRHVLCNVSARVKKLAVKPEKTPPSVVSYPRFP